MLAERLTVNGNAPHQDANYVACVLRGRAESISEPLKTVISCNIRDMKKAA